MVAVIRCLKAGHHARRSSSDAVGASETSERAQSVKRLARSGLDQKVILTLLVDRASRRGAVWACRRRMCSTTGR